MWRRAEAKIGTRFDAKNYRANQQKAVEFEADVGSSYEGNLPLKPPILKRTRSPRKEPGKLTSSWASRRVTQGLAGCEQPLMRVFGGSHGIARYLFAVSIAGLLPTTAAVAFERPAATARQDHYGHRFGNGSSTPEIVVDGTTSHVGSHRTWPTDAFAGTGERRRGRG